MVKLKSVGLFGSFPALCDQMISLVTKFFRHCFLSQAPVLLVNCPYGESFTFGSGS